MVEREKLKYQRWWEEISSLGDQRGQTDHFQFLVSWKFLLMEVVSADKEPVVFAYTIIKIILRFSLSL